MPYTICPSEIEGFKPLFQYLFTESDRVGSQLLSAIARYLDLGPGWFSDPVRDGNSILRLLHYPPVSPGASGIRPGAHEDINLITLLLGADEAGLELLDRNGTWLPIHPPARAVAGKNGDRSCRGGRGSDG